MGKASLRRGLWLLGIAVALVGAAPAAAEPLRLDQALTQARARHPSLRAGAAEVEAARGRLMQAGLIQANPVINGDLARHTQPPDVDLDRGIALGQQIEVGGQGGLRVNAAQYDLKHAELLLQDQLRGVEAEVRHAFAGLAAAQRRLALATETAGLSKRLAETAHQRARAGDIGNLEARLADVEATRAAQAVASAESERARAVARLATAVGAEPDEEVVIDEFAGDTDPTGGSLPEATLVSRALEVRPDLAAARAERSRLEAEARLVHRRGIVPNPTVRGFYRHEVENEEIVGGEIEVPLPVWNREQGTELATLAAAKGAGTEVDRLVREIPRQVHVAAVRRTRARDAWSRYQRDAVPAADSARQLVERAYAGGYLGLPEVLTQQDRLLQVRVDAIAAWLDLREAEADVIEAVGEEAP